jgi:hypothetical protein
LALYRGYTEVCMENQQQFDTYRNELSDKAARANAENHLRAIFNSAENVGYRDVPKDSIHDEHNGTLDSSPAKCK